MTGKNTKTKFPIDIRRESKRLARDKAARWLSGHKDDTPLVNAKAERKQRRRGALPAGTDPQTQRGHLAGSHSGTMPYPKLFRRLRRRRPLRLRCQRCGRVLR